jgi:hypothetical protein
MSCPPKSRHFAHRRLLEVWRAGRPDLQGREDGLVDCGLGRLFTQVPLNGGLKFQDSNLRVRISGS